MFINRFYHETKEPQNLLKIDNNYMILVGKTSVMVVRYGVNAGIWVNQKWISHQKEFNGRNLQGSHNSTHQ